MFALEYNRVMETTTEVIAPTTEPTRKPYKTKNWGNKNWFKAITTSKPKYHSWLDEQKFDRWSTTQQSDNYKTSAGTKNGVTQHNTVLDSTKDYDKYGSYDHSQGMEPGEKATPTMDKPVLTTAAVDEDEDFPRRVFVDNNPDFPDEPHRYFKTTTPSPGESVTLPQTTHLKTTKGEFCVFTG